jgi:hypothetical protein
MSLVSRLPTDFRSPGNVSLTDANMVITNDWPQTINVIVDNNQVMSDTFPSPSTITSGGSNSAHVSASNWPGQSSFDVTFSSGDKMKVLIGTGIYVTATQPEYFPDLKAGAVLAPGTPFSTDTDFNFMFFDGPGVLPPLINSAIQANLPAITTYIASKPITIKITDSISITITSLQVDPSSVVCTYAAALPGTDPNQWNANIVLRVGQATIQGDETIESQTGSLNLSINDLMLYVRVQIDTTFKTKPQITALQCSLGDYSLSGTILAILEVLFPVISQLVAAGATAYRVAGFINTVENETIINLINSAISNSSLRLLSVLGLISAVGKASALATHPRIKLADDLSTWMSTPQIQAKTLGQLKLPGTHDSATYALTSTLSQITYGDIQFLWYLSSQAAPADGTWPITVPPNATNPEYLGSDLYNFVMGGAVNSIGCTQDLSILDQLQAGIRHFDFRVYYDTRDKNFYIQHATQGPMFKDILSQIQAFISKNPTSGELIFAYISHTNLKDNPDQIPALTGLIKAYIGSGNIYYQPAPQNQAQFDFQTLANSTLSSITQGAPKVMFINGDGTDYSYPDTVTNTAGYAGVPWTGELYTVTDLANQQGPPLQNQHPPLWSVGWVLGADTPTIIQNILTLLTGQKKYALQAVATAANAALPGFFSQYGTNFNLVQVDWLEYCGSQTVPQLIIGMNS